MATKLSTIPLYRLLNPESVKKSESGQSSDKQESSIRSYPIHTDGLTDVSFAGL